MSTPSDETTSPGEAPPPTPPPTPNDRIKLVAALIGLVGAALFVLAAVAVRADGNDSSGSQTGGSQTWGGTAISPALTRPEFTLTDTSGRPYDFAAETHGKLTMLFFGYTNCPDVCPPHMAILDSALDTPGMPKATVVFVTTDPDRDTPERLRAWLDNFNADFVGLTGTPEQIAQAERAAQVAGSMVIPAENGDSDDYTVGHAAQMITYTPDDLAHVVYPFGVRREDWTHDLPQLLERWGDTP